MKFLLVSPFTGTSGSAIRYTNIARALSRAGHTVIYAERESPHQILPPIDPAIPTFRCPVSGNLYLDVIRSFFFFLKILLRHRNCDIYFALKPAPNNCGPALIAALMGKKIILDIDDLDYGYMSKGINKTIARFYFDFIPKFFPLVTCHTPALQEYILTTIQIPEKRVYFLAQGISEEFLAFSHFPTQPQKAMVYSATLGITSDFPDLMPLFTGVINQAPEVIINIIGDGVRRAEFEGLVTNQGISKNFVFHGWIKHEELAERLANNWIGINYMRPTFTNQCRAVLKVREYLAVGLQVVCNDVGDARLFSTYVYLEKSLKEMEQRIVSLLKSDTFIFNSEGRGFLFKYFIWDKIVEDFLFSQSLGDPVTQ